MEEFITLIIFRPKRSGMFTRISGKSYRGLECSFYRMSVKTEQGGRMEF